MTGTLNASGASDIGGKPIGACSHRSGREIIQIQVGKSGLAIGHEFLRDLVEEHKINYTNQDLRGTWEGTDHMEEAHLDVFFNEGSSSRGKERWVPRAILVDLNMQDLAMTIAGNLGHLYRPENLVGNDEGSGNCYAKAFHTEGPDLADACLEIVRKEAERCNCLQGVQFTHSVSGGAGSGLNGLIMKTLRDYLDRNSKCIMQSFTLMPAPGSSDIPVEPYNASLAMEDLLDHCDQCFFYDNTALTDICMRSQGISSPSMKNLNNVVALCMSGLTSCLRFKGPLNADLRKLHMNLVPFPKTHFLITSFAPLHSKTAGEYRKQGSVLDLAQQMLSKDNVTVKIDPLNPGDGDVLRSRVLASWASWRGSFQTSEVDKILHYMSKPGSRFDAFFPDWIPNPIASNVCSKGHCELKESVVFVANNTSVHEVFDRICTSWDSLFRHRAYTHTFEQDGISREDMQASRRTMQYISEQYKEFARREDKILGDSGGLNDKAIENPEQGDLAKELKDLTSEDMYIDMRK